MEEKDKEIVSLHEVGDAVLMSDDPNLFTDHIQVFTEGRKYKTLLTKKFAERKKWVAPNPNEIVSHIPGVVASIDVKEGQKVKKGEKLMIFGCVFFVVFALLVQVFCGATTGNLSLTVEKLKYEIRNLLRG